jgi:hypothetical protein
MDLGENGGSQEKVFKLLGAPSFSKKVIVHDSKNFIVGIKPMQCGVSDDEKVYIPRQSGG